MPAGRDMGKCGGRSTRAPSRRERLRIHAAATDGSSDKFRIKIWQTSDDSIVYDNRIGGGDTADLTTALQGGSIKIHKG